MLETLTPVICEDPQTILRGSKSRIYPTDRQKDVMDLWRRRCIQLWNLLLELEQAAYSGENRKSKLGWRSIWARVVEDSHAEAVRVAREGKKRKDGTYRKEPGVRKEPPPLDDAMVAKIMRQMGDAVDVDPETGEVKPAQPRLFLWEHEMQKVMARLKQVPQTHWIDDLPSHAAQHVVKDLVGALQKMLRERKKRATGAGGRDTGFPKFKKNRYASGSVYFANTQLKFALRARGDECARVKLPNGVGWMDCRLPRHIVAAFDNGEAKLMGGRIWRQGEDWFLSCQWKLPKPAPLPPTGKKAGIKIAARIPITICDEEGNIDDPTEYQMPPLDQKMVARHAAAGRAQARALEARKVRVKKREAYHKKRHARKLERGIASNAPGRARIPLSRGFYQAAAKLAKIEAADANIREDWLHKTTTDIVRRFDVIAVHRMEVAKLMKKPKPPEEKLDQVKPAWQGKRRSLKTARTLMRRAAMARIHMVLKYKAIDLRGPDAYREIDRFEPIVQRCSECGHVNSSMKDGRRVLRCEGILRDGKKCRAVLPRHENAAHNSVQHLTGDDIAA